MSSSEFHHNSLRPNQPSRSDPGDNVAFGHTQPERFVDASCCLVLAVWYANQRFALSSAAAIATAKKQRTLSPLHLPDDTVFIDLGAHLCPDCARSVTIAGLPEGA